VRLDEIVLRALEAKPELRFQTAAEFQTQIETIAQAATSASAAPPPMRTPQPGDNPWPRLLRNVAIGIGILILLCGLATCAWFYLAEAPPTVGGTPEASATQSAQEGWRLLQSGQNAEATALFEKAIRLAPGDANSWNGLGWARLNSGRIAEAESAFQKTIALDPNAAGALNGMGQIFLARRDYENAETWLLKAAAQKASAAWYGLARVYLLQGKYADAEKWAQMVVDSGQGDAIATKMVEAAKAQRLSDGLRATIEPPEPASPPPLSQTPK
jgi:tetratricopeptide (TPR) repeat protein